MAEDAAPHVLLVCYPGQGNINPMLRFAKRIAAKGLLVTCSASSIVRDKLAAASGVSAGGAGVPVGRGRVRFDFLDDHLDDGTELDLHGYLRQLETGGRVALAALLRRHAEAGRPVACVVGNPFLPWVTDVAADTGVPAAVMWVQSCAVFSIYFHFAHGLAVFPREDGGDARLTLPGLPAMSFADVPSFLIPSHPYKVFGDMIQDQFRNMGKASWVFVNSFAELERDVFAALPAVTPRPPQLIPVGPLFGGQDDGEAVRGDLIKAADGCVAWLDAQTPRSVVYASLGSVVTLSAEAVAEMAHGLASAGRPFLWVVRPDTQPMLPEGFVLGGRGMVVPWSPQDRVLAHPTVACFLTHCGWNSTLETVAAGVPVVAFPQWGDQCTDAKFLVDELGIGVHLRAPLRREAVREAVDAVTAGPEANAMRANARSWSGAARGAVAPGGSSDRHVQAFVDEVSRRARGRQAEEAPAV
ncbi:unnamed protein product [Urochloa decumbens]|uniref:Glycosyltransferase n=1 Tax=Urochloa decumbens TaxID=240449 RepID=A0ABC9DRE7_9POAL